MFIKDFIKVYDNVIQLSAVSSLIKWLSKTEFKKAGVVSQTGDSVVDFNIRRTWVKPLGNLSNSYTEVHWANFLGSVFMNMCQKYKNDLKIDNFPLERILEISALKYENTGFYTWHSDHCQAFPRTLSIIFMLNNDYEGGNLCFRNPDSTNEFAVDVKPNRLVIWPSNFMYPHTVKSVTKGTRYSIVSWAS